MKPSRKTSRRPVTAQAAAKPSRGQRPGAVPRPVSLSETSRAERLGVLAAWLAILVPPFLLAPTADESFRLPKLMAGEWLALASVLLLSWRLRRAPEVRPADVWRRGAVRAVVPALLAASLGLWTSDHPLHVREALADLWIGAAALVGWSLALDEDRQERLLRGLLWPAAALGLLGILQFHRIFQPLVLVGIEYDPRLSITSLAGNPGDLGAYLVLPALVAQWALARGGRSLSGRARWGIAAALGVCVYAIALTQTLAALAALVLGSALLWALLLPRRLAVAVFGGGAALALVLVLAVAPLRTRVIAKVEQARQRDWNAVLTGRLDGWRAAAWMFREHPWTGVGHGAYLPEFVPAKLALLDRGTPFYAKQIQPMFANAHNEALEVAAEWGGLGLAALAWGLWTLLVALRRAARAPAAGVTGGGGQAALAWAGTAALAVLCMVHFPFRLALVAFPALLFLGWVFRRGDGFREEAA